MLRVWVLILGSELRGATGVKFDRQDRENLSTSVHALAGTGRPSGSTPRGRGIVRTALAAGARAPGTGTPPATTAMACSVPRYRSGATSGPPVYPAIDTDPHKPAGSGRGLGALVGEYQRLTTSLP